MFATGLGALAWFIVRVLPKPSRAAYPCQRAAMPLAAGFLVWIGGTVSCVVAGRRAMVLLRRSRTLMAIGCLGIALTAGLLALLHMPDSRAIASSGPANAPIGVPKGIHPGRVVWVHNPDATSWGGTNEQGQNIGYGYWWQSSHTDQAVVHTMMSRAIRDLAGEKTDADAWRALFQYNNQARGRGDLNYQAGEKICVKVNMATACRSFSNIVDSSGNQTKQLGWVNTSPQMIVALLRQLVNVVGVAQEDITVGDTTCYFPNHYWTYCRTEFPNVRYLASSNAWNREPPTSSQGTPFESRMDWSTPAAAGLQQDYLPVSFAQADYIINLACLKGHSSGITLCGKNHFGSLTRLPNGENTFYNLHLSLPNAVWSPGRGKYRSIVDVMGRSDLGGKTVLYLVDGLYGGYMSEGRPYPWKMAPFNNDWPSSLFASQDPVAIDSVGHDFLLKEWPHIVANAGLQDGAEDYLHEAALANNPPSGTTYDPNRTGQALSSLGVHEHWNNPQDKQYSVNLGLGSGIELVHVRLPQQTGDLDTDGDVDHQDFAIFASCATGSGRRYDLENHGGCPLEADTHGRIAADFDGDADVDMDDFAVYQKCYSGPNRASNANCGG